ncbi:MAG: hypothetical protein AABY22_01195 [Nanoarchaeota archaeon]
MERPNEVLTELESLAEHLTGFFPLGFSIFSFHQVIYEAFVYEVERENGSRIRKVGLEELYNPRKDPKHKDVERFYEIR